MTDADGSHMRESGVVLQTAHVEERTHPRHHARLAQLEPVVRGCLQGAHACALQVLPPQHAPHMDPHRPVCDKVL